MVTPVYECEVCGQRYDDKSDAEACEALGPANRQPCPPIGTVFFHGKHAFYEGFVGVVCGPPEGGEHRHSAIMPVWWFRPSGADDLVDGRVDCGIRIGEDWFRTSGGHYNLAGDGDWRRDPGIPDLNHPVVKRAIAYTRRKGFVPHMIVDGVAVEIPAE